jgi:hypothetical protein
VKAFEVTTFLIAAALYSQVGCSGSEVAGLQSEAGRLYASGLATVVAADDREALGPACADIRALQQTYTTTRVEEREHDAELHDLAALLAVCDTAQDGGTLEATERIARLLQEGAH